MFLANCTHNPHFVEKFYTTHYYPLEFLNIKLLFWATCHTNQTGCLKYNKDDHLNLFKNGMQRRIS